VRARGYDAASLPAVALTAFVREVDVHVALSAGYQVHVPKPVDPHVLTSVIANLSGR
jgi:CheY-like chemotaxis protein